MILGDFSQQALFYLYLVFLLGSAQLLLCLPQEWGALNHSQGTALISTEHTRRGEASLQIHHW